ncbi:type III secretion system protein [Burkholderia sp. ABCPW 14]|uniref:EscU/YscU/HrcU family type III secretion system export apparatus switch protein n=1 Tax=Burkholderia sp. ABCPW 14 TaxID=1637860 RepID=UPI000770DCE5|nr:EscU/YscU/HrcU family type III secretion system export apparatus switch protein [Burkholderia sp. ABCPW 14]KVD78018.1 type III secretion system protein [Burkholderia sp. ABCPW 14]
MSEKTEKPTAKKLRDAAKKGQTFKSKDITAVVVLAVAAVATGAIVDLRRIAFEFARVAMTGATPDAAEYFKHWVRLFFMLITPFVLVCAAAGALPSLVQSRFTLAVESIKFDLTALDPMKGLKKLFSWRAAKEVVKALLYLAVSAAAVWIFIGSAHREISQLFRADPALLGHMWVKLTGRFVLLFLVCAVPVLLMDAIVEYFLYYKDLRMDKHEVKQEHKESEGNPEIKSKRREVHMELLSEAVKSNIEQSDVILANPTHIAIGIYMNADVVPMPFVSVRETNARALAVIRYAEEKGVPVVRDIPLARAVYRRSRRFSFVSNDDFEAVMRVLIWLKQVEASSTGTDIFPQADENSAHAPDSDRDEELDPPTGGFGGRGDVGAKTDHPSE